MFGKKADPLNVALQEGWASACQLYEHLMYGGELTELPPGAIRLEHDEVAYSDAMLGYARFYGTNVSYEQSSMLLLGSATFVAAGLAANAIGNASARRQAEAMAAAQWREHANARTIITNRRLLCDHQGRWLSFWHDGVMEFQVDLSSWLFVLRYQVGEPLMLHGPAAPWFAVIAAKLVYGPRGLQLPSLAPLAQAVAQSVQQRGGPVITGEIVPGPDSSGPQALPHS
ncbi:MAG: hypothetical protein ACRDT8_04520 [Micromonosporaceae bacterium]